MGSVPQDVGVGVRACLARHTCVRPRLRLDVESEDVEVTGGRVPHVGPPGPVVPPDDALRTFRTGRRARTAVRTTFHADVACGGMHRCGHRDQTCDKQRDSHDERSPCAGGSPQGDGHCRASMVTAGCRASRVRASDGSMMACVSSSGVRPHWRRRKRALSSHAPSRTTLHTRHDCTSGTPERESETTFSGYRGVLPTPVRLRAASASARRSFRWHSRSPSRRGSRWPSPHP